MKKILSKIRHAIQKYLCNQIPLKYYNSLILSHPVGIVIASDAKIGENVVVYQNVTIGRKSINCDSSKEYPIIEDNVIIYSGAVIGGGITVGANSVVGPNAVVTKDVPLNSLVVGFNEIKLVNR